MTICKKGGYHYRNRPKGPSPWEQAEKTYTVRLTNGDAVHIGPAAHNGRPVVAGTSFLLSRGLAALADDTRAINALAQDYALDPGAVAASIHAVAKALEGTS